MVKEGHTRLTDAERLILSEFIKDLDKTATQVQQLLQEIQNSKVDVVSIKTELKFLIENVRRLSDIITDSGDSNSVLTRLALLEQTILLIKEQLKDYIVTDTQTGSNIANRIIALENQVNFLLSRKEQSIKEYFFKKENRWKVYIALITTIGSIIVALVKIFVI